MRIDVLKTLLEIQSLQKMTQQMTFTANNYASSPFSLILQQLSQAAFSDERINGQNGLPNSFGLSSPPLASLPNNVAASTSAPAEVDQIIQQVSAKYHVEASLIRSIVQHESGFNPLSKSAAGAMGLMQLMPATARGLGVKNPYNAQENIEGGVKYFKQLLDQYGGDEKMALAAYNAGPGNVAKYGRIPPFSETQNYVKKVMNTYTQMHA